MKKILKSIRKVASTLYKFIITVIFDFLTNNGFFLATGMVYSTLLSLVPFLAILMSIFSIFGGDVVITNFFTNLLEKSIAKSSQDTLLVYLQEFLNNTNKLGVAGAISFTLTSFLLLNKVWGVFNKIYGTLSDRKPIRSRLLKVTIFFLNLIIITILISATISITTILKTTILQIDIDKRFINLLTLAIPWGTIFLTLFVLLKTIPRTRVFWSSSLIAALVGTISWQIINYIFTNLTMLFNKYSIIYGSIASVFIFLIWINTIWINIIFSIEIAYIHQYKLHNIPKKLQHTPASEIATGINILHQITNNYEEGKGDTSLLSISKNLNIRDARVNDYLSIFEAKGYIVQTDTAKRRYIPMKPLNKIEIKDICKTIFGDTKMEEPGKTIASEIIENGVNNLTIKNFYKLK